MPVPEWSLSAHALIIASFALGDPDAIQNEDEFLMSLNRFNVMASRPRVKLILFISRQIVDHPMGHVLSAGTELKHRQNLGEGIDGQPEPEHLRGAAQPGAQLVQLQVRKMEMAEEALVQGVRVPACTGEPPRNRGLSKAEDPLGRGRVQPFGQRREHHSDLVRGGFQAIQRGVASGTEGAVASLTTERLDLLSTAMLAVPDKRMDVSVCDAKVRALRVRTGEALGVDPLGCSPSAFHLRPGTHRHGSRSHS